MHSLTKFSLKEWTKVFTDSLLLGGVAMIEKSLSSDKAKWRDLGNGVADRWCTYTFSLRTLIFSFCLTPNLCSSSMIRRPRLLKPISFCRSAWVPIIISIAPCFNSSKIIFFCLMDTSLLIFSILIAVLLNLLIKFLDKSMP